MQLMATHLWDHVGAVLHPAKKRKAKKERIVARPCRHSCCKELEWRPGDRCKKKKTPNPAKKERVLHRLKQSTNIWEVEALAAGDKEGAGWVWLVKAWCMHRTPLQHCRMG